ncbi:MAG: ribosome-recycling factor [Minisyncoccia bacterium]
MYDFSNFKKQGLETIEWLRREFTGIRTGRATPAILDNISVESYGTMMKIKEVASIGIEDARTLRVSPWDMSQSKNIEKAVMLADLGLSVAVDDKGLRISFPELSAERRTALLKVAKAKLEEARVAVRTEREKIKREIMEDDDKDSKFRNTEELQKLVDGFNSDLEAVYERKEKEIAE